MFRCKCAPPEPAYEDDLEKLGFRLNEYNQFVNIKDGGFFDYFHTNNERVNDLRKEAFHSAARAKFADVLREENGIHEYYLSAVKLLTERPNEPHVSILCTKVSELKHKRDIVVVVGESSEDAGIWAWRVAGKEGGIKLGSAVGLAEKLAKYGQNTQDGDGGKEVKTTKAVDNAGKMKTEQDTPGLIIMNPGQLLYSHKMNKNMTKVSWDHRRRPNALSQPYTVDEEHNHIPGHKDAADHIHTCFEHVFQHIMPDGARLYFIMIGDGSTHALNALDQVFINKNDTKIRGGTVEAVAFVEPRHDAGEITDRPNSPDGIIYGEFKNFLARQGMSWVASDTIPKGGQVAIPIRGMPAIEYAPDAFFPTAPSDDAGDAAESRADTMNEAVENGSHDAENDKDSVNQLCPSAWDLPPTPTPMAPKTDAGKEWLEEEQEDAAPESEPVSSYTISAGPNETAALETVFPTVQDEVLEFLFWHMERAREWEAFPEKKPKAPQPRDSE